MFNKDLLLGVGNAGKNRLTIRIPWSEETMWPISVGAGALNGPGEYFISYLDIAIAYAFHMSFAVTPSNVLYDLITRELNTQAAEFFTVRDTGRNIRVYPKDYSVTPSFVGDCVVTLEFDLAG